MVDDLLDAMTGEVDFVDAFAFPLPVNVIGELLGVPAEDRAQFQPLVRDWTRVLDVITPDVLRRPIPRRPRSGVPRRAWSPSDGVRRGRISSARSSPPRRRATSSARTRCSPPRRCSSRPASRPPPNLLANSLMALLDHPGQLAALRATPDLAAPAVEELLRFDAPVQILGRLTIEPVELGGTTVDAGERVVAYIGSGNRDPQRFDEPDRLRLDRADNAPLSFGGGIHYCLGAPLARLEAQVALPALVRGSPGDPRR
jgi:cytochrome P450